MEEFGFVELPLRAGDTFLLGGLPDVPKDPFDRMLVCQALDHGLTLITPDPQLLRYPVPVLW
jgi:PIN domain nuclease of toxin-antitoxin system